MKYPPILSGFWVAVLLTCGTNACKKPDTTKELIGGTHTGTCYSLKRHFDPAINDLNEIRDTVQNSELTITPVDDDCFNAEGCGTYFIEPYCLHLTDTDTLFTWSDHRGVETWSIELNTKHKTIHTNRQTQYNDGYEEVDGYFKY